MTLFELIRKKHEDRILAKAKLIEEKRLKQEQRDEICTTHKVESVCDEQVEIKQETLEEKILNSKIPVDYIISMYHDVKGDWENRDFLQEYFLSDVEIKDMQPGEKYSVMQITGKNIGKKATLTISHKKIVDFLAELVDCDGKLWFGDTSLSMTRYIHLYKDDTISTLNDMVNERNAKVLERYKEDIVLKQKGQETVSQIFK